jgi:hypothetical protein
LLATLLRDPAFADSCLHPNKARRRSGRAASRRRRYRCDRDSQQQITAATRNARSPASARAVPESWWPRTSPRAGSMWSACRMSSTSSYRTCRKTMSTGSDVPRTPVRPVRQSPSAADEERPHLRDIEKLTRRAVRALSYEPVHEDRIAPPEPASGQRVNAGR